MLTIGLVAGVLAVTRSADAGAGGNRECGSNEPLTLSVAPELTAVARRAADQLRGECVELTVAAERPVEVSRRFEFGSDVPDLWIPDSYAWQAQLYLNEVPLKPVSTAVASSPVVLAGGEGTERPSTWRGALADDTVDLRDPLSHGVGALTVLAVRSELAATGASDAKVREAIVPLAQRYGERLDGAAATATVADVTPGRMVPVTEQELWQAAKRGAAKGIEAWVPDEGAPLLQYPLYTPADADKGTQAAARALAAWLASPAGQETLASYGFRNGDGKPLPKGTAKGAAADTQDARLMALPVPFAAAGDLQLWQSMSQPSSVLAVFDASGSMDFPAGAQTRMELAVGVAQTALEVFPDRARIGLWVFSIDQGGRGQDWRELEPMRRLDTVVKGWTQRQLLDGQAALMTQLTDGGTGLYDTTLAAYRTAVEAFDPAYSNTVILLTDGANDDPGSISLEKLVGELERLRSPRKPVRIIGIGISDDADHAALARISEATGGRSYRADNPQDILDVFAQAIASR